jgi:hypothetical protein
MWSGPSSLHMSDSVPSRFQRLECTWHDEPTSSIEYLAMNVSERPLSPAISLAPFL